MENKSFICQNDVFDDLHQNIFIDKVEMCLHMLPVGNTGVTGIAFLSCDDYLGYQIIFHFSALLQYFLS